MPARRVRNMALGTAPALPTGLASMAMATVSTTDGLRARALRAGGAITHGTHAMK